MTAARVFLLLLPMAANANTFAAPDLSRLRSVSDIRFAPDGRRSAYTVQNNDKPGRPYSQLWILTVADGKSARLMPGPDSSSEPEWSPDGSRLVFSGKLNGKSGLLVAAPRRDLRRPTLPETLS